MKSPIWAVDRPLGMRASEIISRVVRDIDDNGRLLWIPDSKTEAGKRNLASVELNGIEPSAS